MPNKKFTTKNTMQYILKQFPECQFYWEKHLEYWQGDEDKRTFGIDLDSFFDFIINKIKEKRYTELPCIFDLIEYIKINGDEEVNNAIVIFLEDLTNTSSNNPDEIPYEVYIPLLGKESKQACKELDMFWKTKTPGLWSEEEGFNPPPPKKMINELLTSPCPVCDRLSFYTLQFPGSLYECLKCGWIDNKEQYENPKLRNRSNVMSLEEAQQAWKGENTKKETNSGYKYNIYKYKINRK